MQIPQWLGYVIIAIVGFILIAYLMLSGLLPTAFEKVLELPAKYPPKSFYIP